MLLPKVSVLALLIVHASAADEPSVAPRRIAFQSLLGSNANDGLLLDGLTKDGLVSVTGIPEFKATKRALLSHLHACIASLDDDDVPTQSFDDGTVRRSFATSTRPDGAGMLPIQSLEDAEALAGMSDSCQRFKSRATSFRAAVGMATGQFAARLSAEMGASLPTPLLSGNSERVYDDIAQVVAGGEHLEHFHSYQKIGGQDVATTIDLHTDQGFFIAFTPGLIVSAGDAASEQVELSDGFYIQDSNGESRLMEFTDDDDLVFMMGDGVNQFINNRLVGDAKGLRATPHALTLPAQEDGSKARVWYGRMVLAPSDAYLPSQASTTFGETRQFLVETEGNTPLGIGCSSPNTRAVVETSRKLDGPSVASKCPEDEMFCWFRCQKLSDHGLTATTCTERRLTTQCVNPRMQVVPDGMKHGDYVPACTNNTAESHPVTTVPQLEVQDEAVCTDEKFEEFIGAEGYDKSVDLTVPDGTKSILSYSIVTDAEGNKKVKARLAFDDVFGWLGLGFADVLSEVHNGMNGGSVLLAIPGGNYSAVTGLDMDVPASIATYKIYSPDSAFRHWMDPVDTDEAKATVADFEDTGCFVALTFESDHINGQKFNLDGTDEMIWAGNHYDHWMSYHQRGSRARFTMDWTKGEAVIDYGDVKEEEEVEVMSAGSVKSGIIGVGVYAFASMAYSLFAS